MGCDIHVYTERKVEIDGKEIWASCDHFKKNPYAHEEGEQDFEVVPIYKGRNYNLFSHLADVRNYHGNKILSEPKGIPANCCKEILKENEEWDCDGHSHSFATLGELKRFRDENKISKYSGLMLPKEAERVDNGEMPHSWCQGTNRDDYVYREWEFESNTMDSFVDALETRAREEFWIFGDNPTDSVDEKIRVVFWFDN